MLIILLKKNRRKSPISINYRGFAQEIKYHTLNLQGTTTRDRTWISKQLKIPYLEPTGNYNYRLPISCEY